MHLREALPYLASQGFSHSAYYQGRERGKCYYYSKEILEKTVNFWLSYNRAARVEPNFVALLRGFSGQASP